MQDFSSDIIIAPYNGILNLPGICMSEAEAISFANSVNEKERLHKIEIDGENSRSVSIFIDGKELCVLKDDECIYATEVRGKYLRLLPNSGKQGVVSLHLKNLAGRFESTLIETVCSFGKITYSHSNVTQFGFSAKGKPVYSSSKYYEPFNQ